MTAQDKGSRPAGAGRRAGGAAAKEKTRTGPHPIDVHVGARVRLRRTALKMSQDKLGEAVGLTFQQIQKYERGTNRIGASRLFEFSTFLDVPISYFFEDLPGDALLSAHEADIAMAVDLGPETLRLIKQYYRIADRDVRRRLYELIKSVAPERE